MKKKSYKWLLRLIDKITNKDCSNNNAFTFYGREVVLQSGTSDYMDVTIHDRDGQICFSFDFWIKELCLTSYADYDQRDAIINAFRSFYRSMTVELDEPWDEEEKFYLPMLDNDDYDQDEIRREYNALLLRKAA